MMTNVKRYHKTGLFAMAFEFMLPDGIMHRDSHWALSEIPDRMNINRWRYCSMRSVIAPIIRLIWSLGLVLAITSTSVGAFEQSVAPADRATTQKIGAALIRAGIDPRITSVQVITTSDHTVYLTGLISDRSKIKLAGEVAAKVAPSYKIVNNIYSSFFDDPNHVHGRMTK